MPAMIISQVVVKVAIILYERVVLHAFVEALSVGYKSKSDFQSISSRVFPVELCIFGFFRSKLDWMIENSHQQRVISISDFHIPSPLPKATSAGWSDGGGVERDSQTLGAETAPVPRKRPWGPWGP